MYDPHSLVVIMALQFINLAILQFLDRDIVHLSIFAVGEHYNA
jgi:hypothetical protein